MKKILGLTAFSLLCLTACSGVGSLKPSMMEDSVVSKRAIELHTNRHIETMDGKEVTSYKLSSLADDYNRHGESPLYIAFGYDPDNARAKQTARSRAAIAKGQLGKLGLNNNVVDAIPVNDSNGSAVIAYDRLTAKGPQNCGVMPGTQGTQTGAYGDYGLGCTVNDMIAQQIATPSDLEGVGGLGERNDGLRTSNIVNRDVRAGEVNRFVPSYVLSELAANTTE